MKVMNLLLSRLLVPVITLTSILPFENASARSNRSSLRVSDDTGRFSKLRTMLTFGRSGHNVQRLADGRILIAGGAWGDLGGENSAEILQIQQIRSRSVEKKMSSLRTAASMTTFPDGRIFFIGGATDFEPALLSTDIFDPQSNSFAKGPDMIKERSGHASVALSDGRVLVFGGTDGYSVHDSIEIYDPRSGTFSIANTRMSIPRANHTATRVNEKTIAIIGGETETPDKTVEDQASFLDTIELFDIPSLTFIPINNKMQTPRIYHTATRLDDQRVLITGGLRDIARSTNSIEVLNVKDRSIVEIGFALHGRSSHTLTALRDGSFLMAGGVEDGTPLANSERCRMISATDINCLSGANMSHARWNHTATQLSDGRILFIGGLTNTPEAPGKAAGPIRGLEVFYP